MKKGFVIGLVLFALFLHFSSAAQQNPVPRIEPMKTNRVAIFAPLYLDSVFDGTTFRYAKKTFPRFAAPGLEFVNGALLALDSMNVYGGNIFATVYDSKSYTDPIESLINRKILDSVNLIIGNVKDEEFITLANFSAKNRIPFISATYPNDGGITNNPFLVILNSTLKAHCEAIFAHLAQNKNNKNFIYVRKSGKQEDAVQNYFDAVNKNKLINFKVINADDASQLSRLNASIDTLRENVIIGASLNKTFAEQVIAKSSELSKKAKITLIGMPNWENFSAFAKKNNKDFPFYYTNTYYNSQTNGTSQMMQSVFKSKYNNTPSEMAYRGYESVFIFSRLLARYPDDFMNHLNEFAYKVFTDYVIQPVNVQNNGAGLPDYFENKRIYFLEVKNGFTNLAWK